MSTPHTRVAKAVEDVAYVTIGLGLMAFQKAQVRRQELSRAWRDTVGDNLKVVEERLRAIAER
jgi:hypothetical protein